LQAALVVGQITLGAFVIVEKLHAGTCNYAPGNGINSIYYDTYDNARHTSTFKKPVAKATKSVSRHIQM
jgi:hypothetical protein